MASQWFACHRFFYLNQFKLISFPMPKELDHIFFISKSQWHPKHLNNLNQSFFQYYCSG
jgi:hypothetical protein